MTDLTDRLRARMVQRGAGVLRQNVPDPLCDEAADALDAKDRRIAELEAALEPIAKMADDIDAFQIEHGMNPSMKGQGHISHARDVLGRGKGETS